MSRWLESLSHEKKRLNPDFERPGRPEAAPGRTPGNDNDLVKKKYLLGDWKD